MSGLSVRRAALIAGGVACLVFINATANEWAVDDTPLIDHNPAAQSLGAAMRATFSPYWPATATEPSAGLYRPVVVVSYAVDWIVSGGRAGWFHLTNVLLHGVVSALVVLVAAMWLPPLGALAAGLVFAIHPVHVEAVANVVGRAEIMAGLGLLLAVLAARRYRRTVDPTQARWWLTATLAAVLFALLSKENAVVGVVFLALDHGLDPERPRQPTGELYVAIAALTLGWFFVWRGVAGSYVTTTTADNFRGLTAMGRLATMLPVQLDVIRLLSWPLQLSHDYHPLVVPQRTAFGGLALLGLLSAGACLALGVVCCKRAPAVAFGILAGAASYAPTSNLVFGSGVALAERNLYLAALAPALSIGWLLVWSRRFREKRVAILAAAALAAVYAGRTVTRTPFWKDTRTTVIEGVIEHPENFRNRVRVGRISELTGDSARALAEYLVAGALFDRAPLVATLSVPLALRMGRPDVAVAEAQRAGIARLLVDAYAARGDLDSAAAVAESALRAAPLSRAAAQLHLDVLHSRSTPPWRLALAQARLDWLSLNLAAASRGLDSLPTILPTGADDPALCLELETLWPGVQALRPAVGNRLAVAFGAGDGSCDLPAVPG